MQKTYNSKKFFCQLLTISEKIPETSLRKIRFPLYRISSFFDYAFFRLSLRRCFFPFPCLHDYVLFSTRFFVISAFTTPALHIVLLFLVGILRKKIPSDPAGGLTKSARFHSGAFPVISNEPDLRRICGRFFRSFRLCGG